MMATAPVVRAAQATASSFSMQFTMQLRTELKRLFRNFRFVFFTLFFPALFYLLMNHVFGSSADQGSAGAGSTAGGAGGGTLEGLQANAYMLVSMTAYGVMGAGLNLFGTNLAQERAQGWMRLLRTTPLRGSSSLLARWSVGLLFSALTVVVMMAIGYSQGIRLDAAEWLSMGAVLWLGALPFGALGLALGYWVDAKSGQVVSMMLYFFLSIFGGLWWPIEIMPKLMQTLAGYLPSYHYAHLARLALTGGMTTEPTALLVGYTAAFLLLAWWGWRRDEAKVYA